MITEDKTITITARALNTLEAIYDHVHKIEDHYGFHSNEANDARTTLLASLTQMIRLGGRITEDGKIELLCWNDHIQYGINFHATYRADDNYLAGRWSVNS